MVEMTESIRKASKRSSVVWNHYTLSDCKTKVTCLHCSQKYAYACTAMSNLSRHIKRKHPEVTLEHKVNLDNDPKQICNVNEVVGQRIGDFSFESYEIIVKGFEELNQETGDQSKDISDPDWVPETEENSKLNNKSECGPTKPKKSKVQRSILWNHFKKSVCGNFGRCVHCGKSIKLGTLSNLSRHLRHKHPTLANIRANLAQDSAENNSNEGNDDICDKNMLSDEIEVSSELNNENLLVLSSQFSFEPHVDESCNIQFGCPDDDHLIVQPKTTQESQTECLLGDDFDMCDYLKPKKNLVVSEHIDFQLVKMIVKGCHSLRIVEQCGFKDFVALLNPRYQLPDSGKICQELIPALYKECEKRASKSLRDAEGICLFLDLWVSRRTRYMSISAHFINVECKLESLFLSCHILSTTESPEEISERLLETVSDWEITDKIVAVTTDNTLPLSVAAKLCQWTHIPHFIKVLNLILNECLQAIKSLVNKVKSHVEYLTKNNDLMAKLYSKQKSLKLPQVRLFIAKAVCSWNSSFTTLDMLTKYTKLKPAICQPDLPGAKLSDSEWRILKSVVDILGMFKTVRKEVEVEGNVTLAKVAFYLRALTKEFIKQQNNITNPSDAVYIAAVGEKSLSAYFKELEETDLIKKSLLLDPRLKKHVFGDESESVAACSKLKQEVCKITLPDKVYGESSSDSIWYAFDNKVKKLNEIKDPIGKGILEFDNYLQEQLLQRGENPLVWWNQRKSIYPRLYKLAKKYLCVTTKPPMRESISYRCAYMLNNLKNSGPNNLESEVMFLYHNM